MNQEIFEKEINKKTNLIIGSIFIAIGIFMIFFTYYLFQNDEKKIRSLHEVILEDKKEEYAYLNVEMMTEEFAVLDNQNAYFIWDDKYAYIVVLKKEDRESLNAIFEYSYDESKEKPESVRIKGYTKEIPSDLKRIAIECYNEIFEEQILTQSNFSDYLGLIYLDTNNTPMNQYGIAFFVIAGILILTGSIISITYFTNKKKTKKYLEKYAGQLETIKFALDNPDNFYLKKQKAVLTKDYLVTFQGGLQIIDYKDIIWYYPYEQRVNGAITNRSLYIITSDFTKHVIGNFAVYGKDKENFTNLYAKISEYCPTSLEGYTKENQKLIKEKKANQ